MMISRKWLSGIIACALLLTTGCGGDRSNTLAPNLPYYSPNQDNIYNPKPDTHGYNPAVPAGISYSVLQNVFLRVDPEIGAQIAHLEGTLIPKRPGDPVIFDDVRSFVFNIFSGQLSLDNANISRLKNKYVFNYADCPLKDIDISFTPGRISMKGKMKQVIWVPFEMEGTISPTPDGMLIMIPDAIRVSGIPAKGMMDAIGLQTSKLLKLAGDRGVTLQGNNIILDPTKLFPPPQIAGKVVAVDVQNNKLTLFFDSPQRVPRRVTPDVNARNYMHVYGGNFLIMNELQRGAELQMVDMNPTDMFDFYLGEYKRHLKAGYVKVMNDQGSLITLMPDYPKINSTNVWDQYPGGAPTGNAQSMRSMSANAHLGASSVDRAPLTSQNYMPAIAYWKQ
jgi:hypothetical protein